MVEHVLSIHLIADEILRHVRDGDILQCSLVSRFWRRICRRYLRDRKVYLLRTNPNCSSLQLVNDLVGNSVDLPFSGLSFQDVKPGSSEGEESKGCRNTDVIARYPFLFSQLDLKVLKISWNREKDDCVGEKFLREIFRRKVESIEEMIISDWPDSIPSLWSFLNQTGESMAVFFPSLRICRLRKLPEESLAKPVLIREILLSAPRLSYLDGIIPPAMFSEDEKNLTAQFPRNKFGVIKAFRALDTHSVCALAEALPRLEYLSLWPSLIDQGEEMIEKGRKGITSICKSSTESLKVLSCRHNMNMLRQFIPGRRFPNLTRLHVNFSINEFYHVNYMLFKTLNFRYSFPSLSEVELTFVHDPAPDQGYFPDCETLKKQLLRKIYCTKGRPDRYYCSSVTKVLLIYPTIELYIYTTKIFSICDAAEVFPNVRTLCLKEFSESDLCKFWYYLGDFNNMGKWKCLETLGYYCNTETWRFPYLLHYIFCCIHLYELQALLQDLDESSLKAWQHAPRKFWMNDFSRVPKIQLFFEHKGRAEESCNRKPIPYAEDVETVFSQTMTWIRAKMSELLLEVVVLDPCSKDCDPFRLDFPRDFVQVKKRKCTSSDRVQLCWTFNPKQTT